MVRARRPTKAGAPAREPVLEAAMFDARDDERVCLVYADWLTSHGNPWGELMTVQAQLEKSRANPPLLKREAALLKKLALPPRDLGTVKWVRGRIDSLHIFNERDWSDAGYDVMATLEPLFALPMMDGLRELMTGVIRWGDLNRKDVPAVLEAAAARPFARRLESLVLGRVSGNVDMAHHSIGDVRRCLAWFPALRSLKLCSGGHPRDGVGAFDFGPLVLPKLESLVIETCSLTKERLDQVFASTLPSLTRLVLWFGSKRYGANPTAKDLTPLLEGKLFPNTTRIGLKNHEFADALAAALPGSAVASRVVELDLSLGTLASDGVQALIAGAATFPKLEVLDVSGNYVTPAETRALQDAFKGVTVTNTESRQQDPDEPSRYVVVRE